MVNKYDFDKQFGNMGIDRESIMNANKKDSAHTTPQVERSSLNPETTVAPQEQANFKPETQSAEQELMIVKRKLEYLQTNVLKKFEEKFIQLEQKIVEKNSKVVDYSRDIIQLRNEVADLKNKLSTVRVSFGDTPAVPRGMSETPTQAPSSSNGENNSSVTPAQAEQAKVRVEDYFNFSNKKFD